MLPIGRLELIEVWGRIDTRLRWAKKSRLIILKMLLKLEMGRKLAGLLASSPGFLRSDETTENLNVEGKMPWLKDRLARVEMSTEKTELHDLMRKVFDAVCQCTITDGLRRRFTVHGRVVSVLLY
jgi:hypothetical protein